MKTKKIFRALFTLTCLLQAGQAFAGTNPLANTTITATYNGVGDGAMFGLDYVNSLLSSPLSVTNVTQIDPTDNPVNVEFTTGDSFFDIGFSKSGLVTFENLTIDGSVPGGPVLMTFDFSGLSQNITGFSVANTSTISGAPIFSVINGHSISADLTNVTWNGIAFNSGLTAQLAFASPVPEPTTSAMLLAGLAVLGLSRRNQRK
ncbi:MAG TPA: PEP-CTERM sorting domain-containing protein [Rhodocyclaceae bacterium]|nr:PEP-CTERM sorting domain-containing protein [Rhodocyclaceae bacterium]